MMHPSTSNTQIIQLIDFTSLNATDNESSLLNWLKIIPVSHQALWPAAICVYPNHGHFIRQNISEKIKVAVVAAAFPSTQTFLEVKKKEFELVAKSSVQEVDVVINIGEFLNGNYAKVKAELSIARKILKNKTLKVILETGDLVHLKAIKLAAEIAVEAGADFIKTSTGKSLTGARPEAVEVMCKVILEHFIKTGKKIGIKPSGGIKTKEEALAYMALVSEKLGEDWLNPSLFRIGASSLYNSLLKDL